MNCVNLTGRLTNDPEIKTSQKNGKDYVVANFTLAVNRKYKAGGQSADFIRCVGFGNIAEILRDYFKKGMKADISGEIRTASIESNGEYKNYTNVKVTNLEFGESKSAFNGGGSTPNTVADTNTDKDDFMKVSDDNLPFNF